MVPSSSRRNAPIGVSRSALRVARSRIVSAPPARRLASVRLSGSVIACPSFGGSSAREPAAPENQETTFISSGRKVVPSAVPPSFGGVPHSDRRTSRVSPPDRSIGAALYRWRSAPEPTCRPRLGRLAFGPVAPGSIRRRRHPGLHQPPGLWNGARRVLVPIKARLRDVARSLGAAIRGRQAVAHAAPAEPAPDQRQPREPAQDLEEDRDHDDQARDRRARAPAPARRTRRTPRPSRRRRPRCCPSWCRRPPARG